jgi:HAD superfamily hydrolase (TIGR01459 family)
MIKTNFKLLADKYSCFLFDQWGVIHNGRYKYKFVNKTLSYLKKHNKTCILISNTSQSSNANIIGTLNKIKINKNLYKKNVTSGELLINYLKLDKPKKISNILKLKYCYFISNGKENEILEKLKLKKTIKKNSMFILASSIKPCKNINKYKEILKYFKNKKKIMICTNPDKETIDIKNKSFLKQVGSLAEYFQSIGGKVTNIGKPYKNIFDFALKKIKFEKKKIIMIGDTFDTDIVGAKNAGIKSALVLNKDFTKRRYYNKKIKPDYLINDISI